MFHDHNDDVRQQSVRFETTQDRHGLTVLRDDLETTTRLFSPNFHTHGEEVMVPYILVGMFVAFETEKLRRAILSGAGALVGGKRRLSALTRSIQPQCEVVN
jgi:hypothetical protein